MSDLLTFLRGTVDPASNVNRLRGDALALFEIGQRVEDDALVERILQCVEPSDSQQMKIPIDACRPLGLSGWPDPTRLVFPEPTGIDVNMMPFDMFSPWTTLPPELHGYMNMILTCPVVRTGVTGRCAGAIDRTHS